ncbi:MAG: MetQ/NlpA family ABC transporter substrate-binding protein [Tissierellia bacterium]|nr:MetQ/NlpA family ABC transporter substrate-binding protein [Tissierellia bacterium]
MKNSKKLITAVLSLGLLLTACSSKDDNNSNTVSSNNVSNTQQAEKIVIGVSPMPHAEIAEVAKDYLAKEGIELEIKVFDDYVTPNNALDEGDIDANFFQHHPYLENFNKENGLSNVAIANVHIEPLGLYSKKYKSFDEIEDGAEVIIPNDPTNGARALKLLEDNGLIKIDENAGTDATENDITDNPKNLKFVAMEAPSISRTFDDSDLAIINSNYALQDGLSPVDDTIATESTDSPYANVIAVRKEDKDSEKSKKLIEAFGSKEVEDFINEKYKGAVIPAFKELQ